MTLIIIIVAQCALNIVNTTANYVMGMETDGRKDKSSSNHKGSGREYNGIEIAAAI